eukprot:COSAG03_NODE_105_length_12702_cov_43.786162_4_plen_234_part_00
MPRIPATARALAFALLLLHTMGAAVENGDDAGEVLYVELGGRVAILTARCCARLAEGSTRPLKLDDEDYDVVVYGATSGGVVAAVAAVRAGAPRVALLDPGSRIGGMSAGGLSSTDTGNAAVIGGMARQFYLDNGRHYNLSQPEYMLEPHVALQIFQQMVVAANISLFSNAAVETVSKTGSQIASLTTVQGRVFRAYVFIEADCKQTQLLAKCSTVPNRTVATSSSDTCSCCV